MTCDHGALSPDGSVVVVRYGASDCRRWWAQCRECGKVVGSGCGQPDIGETRGKCPIEREDG